MLSSEQPSGPSCSFKSTGPGVSTDPATSVAEGPPSQDPRDLVQPYPKFSIRDYVFASRSKGIKRSWPFHPHSLQLCLERGVKDPLPPFESPDLIRSQPLNISTDFEQSAACLELNSVGLVKNRDASSLNEYTGNINFQSCQPVDESLGPLPYTSPEDGKSGINQVGSTNESDHPDEVIPIDLQDNSCTKASQQIEVDVPLRRLRNLDLSCEPSEKKCKFVVKLGATTDIRRAEDIASNSSSVSDPMASKTCPVCKVFASTSNTTLNAHIDQCLSAESNTELVETVLVKPKVKPRKKRLMVDIYKTALPCTLEDLDQRNGTNWAVELSMSPVSREVCTENRSPEMVSFDRRDDEREGDVYVDSNGIKIRILSKCNDVPLVLRDDLGSRKVAKHGTGKGILMSKKMLKSKLLKNKKLKMHGKKYNKTSPLNSQVQAYPHDDINEETSEEEWHARNPFESTSNCCSRTMQQWVCSKRSDIAKSLSRNHSGKAFDKVIPGAQKSDRNNMLGFNDSQVPESPAGAFSSESPEYMATTSEAIGVEQSNGPSKVLRSIPTWSSKTHRLQSSVMPKTPRSAAALAKRKIKEIGRREATKLDNYNIVRNPTSVKRSETRTLSFTAGPSNGSNRLASTSKKIRKHRSLLRTGKRAFSPFSTRVVHGFGEERELDTRHVNKKFRITSNEVPKKFLKHTEEDTADNDFSLASDMTVSGQQNDQYDVAQETEGTQMDCEGEDAETDVPYDSVSRSDPADCCNQISDVSLSPENNRTTDDDVLVEGYSVAVEDPNSSEKLAHGHESNCATNNEMDEWQMDPTSTKESSPCLVSNRDMGPGGPQDNSSITSNGENFNQEHGLPLGQDSLDSPVSTASTMSPPAALKDSRINDEEPGPSTGRTVEEQITGCLNQEAKSIPMAREGELPKEKPFRCSCQENISRESHQSVVARPTLNFTGKQVPQLHIGSRASSSFSMYQRTSAKPNPCLDSHEHLSAAKVAAESAVSLPSYSTDCISPSLQTQLPSPSNPILRLMGKDLMVMNNEESVHPQAPSSDYILRGNYEAPVGFMPPSYQHLGNSGFISMPPTAASHQIPLPSVQASGLVAPPLHSVSMMQPDHHSQQKSYRNIMPAMHHPTYMMKEVIVIKDSPERSRTEPQASMLFPPAPPPALSIPNNTPPRPFYCLPPQIPILPRERAAGSMPVYANFGALAGVSPSSQESQTGVTNPYMPNPFFVQSRTGYMNHPPVYYSQNLG
ncbi:hypothetical protein Zm00014a_043604 [Zea mays]|uniref:Hapless 8 n=1 Tax=Zea mays TaxID=4577 RepID=A0A3L6G6Z4_MAIZE|nr:hypothetical protein Zm00014a_043604 [Zea mays]PWZ44180.1 hypothetical protein Zm00014a_043604 [Zea mays]